MPDRGEQKFSVQSGLFNLRFAIIGTPMVDARRAIADSELRNLSTATAF
ncbi:MAG: hypothetical protein KME40_19320 [Komarekiella atlantica HA4396-MV6]|nr:hypothetical protein [Komarekiella atlantica HA4396-MV6]